MSIPARHRSLFSAVFGSVLVHLVFLAALPWLLEACEDDAWAAQEIPTDAAARPDETIVEVVEEPASPEMAPAQDTPAEVPEAVPKAAQRTVPKPPEPKPVPEKRPDPKKKLHDAGALMIDQPLVEEEREPPPDTKVLGPQDRKVDVEMQTRKRALAASDEKKRRRLAADAAEDKKPPKDTTTQDEAKADKKGNPDTKEPAEPSVAQSKARQVADEVSKARKAQRKGKAGSPVEAAAANAPMAPDGMEAPGLPGSAVATPGEAGGGARVDVKAALAIDPGMYQEMFGARDAQDRKRLAGKTPRLLGRWQKRAAATRAALENFVPKVRYGNHVAINSRKSVYAAWVASVHRGIHRLWGMSYLRHLDLNFGMGHELSDPTLKATIEFVIDGVTGEIDSTTIVSTSGVLDYDAEAIRVVQAIAPTKPPPRAVHSPDGKVYVHWNFWRDTRQCGTFGVSIYKLNDDGRLDQYEVTHPVDDLGHAH